jgi:hypothetical protein
MPRSRRTLARIAPALFLVAVLPGITACVDSPTAPPRPPLSPIEAEPAPGIFTPLLLPADADWGHYFVSFNPDRHLSVEVRHYPDGSVEGRGIFVVPGLARFGTLQVTTLVNTFDGCTPYSTPCDENHTVPESSTVSGVGLIGAIPLTFELVLDSHLWPPQGWTPGADPGTDYDAATLTVCTLGTCTTTTFYGELHHEPD